MSGRSFSVKSGEPTEEKKKTGALMMPAKGPGTTGFSVAEWRVDPSTNRIALAENEIKLEPKVMDVLV